MITMLWILGIALLAYGVLVALFLDGKLSPRPGVVAVIAGAPLLVMSREAIDDPIVGIVVAAFGILLAGCVTGRLRPRPRVLLRAGFAPAALILVLFFGALQRDPANGGGYSGDVFGLLFFLFLALLFAFGSLILAGVVIARRRFDARRLEPGGAR